MSLFSFFFVSFKHTQHFQYAVDARYCDLVVSQRGETYVPVYVCRTD